MAKKKVNVVKVEKIWLSTTDAAEYLGMSKEYVAKLRRNGLVPHCMIGNAAFFLKEDIDYLLEKNRVF